MMRSELSGIPCAARGLFLLESKSETKHANLLSVIGKPPLTMRSLTSHQRNLYFYFLNHQEKRSDEPCYVPTSPVAHGRLNQYFQALERLEELHLVTVDREAADYREWVMLPPENEISVRSPGQIRSVPSPLWQSAPQQRCTA